jgi:mono/diheme cytochrome c family protein
MKVPFRERYPVLRYPVLRYPVLRYPVLRYLVLRYLVRIVVVPVASVLVAAACLALAIPTMARADDDKELLTRGRAIVTKNCGSCHAVERQGNSPHPEALPFRQIGRHYPVESLEEALGEGLISGHPDMPEFVFSGEEVGAIIAYLKAIQD